MVTGGDGNDSLWPGSGQDVEFGGDGNDRLHALANDNQVDTLDCGAGDDTAIVNLNERDVVAANCEHVIRIVPTPGQAGEDDK
jgi:Ca2+-binding RTX toxin-like protein